MPNKKIPKVCTFVFNAGNETPIKKPKTIPIKVVTRSLILSLGFLLVELQQDANVNPTEFLMLTCTYKIS